MKDRFIIDADETGLDLTELGINHKPPSPEEIHWLLWGIAPGQPIPNKEFDTATLGEGIDEQS